MAKSIRSSCAIAAINIDAGRISPRLAAEVKNNKPQIKVRTSFDEVKSPDPGQVNRIEAEQS